MREDHMTSYGIGMKIENPAYIVSLSLFLDFEGLLGVQKMREAMRADTTVPCSLSSKVKRFSTL